MIYNEDCIKVMKTLDDKCVDSIITDPPYFLSNGGKSIHSGKIVSVNKGEWDKKENYSDVYEFTYNWLKECYRLLKNKGSIWISGTYHNLFDVQKALDEIGFKIINIVIWNKLDPPPLIYKNKFRFSYEFLVWANKGLGHYFNYEAMYDINKEEMTDVWKMPSVSMNEKAFGYHPTQKPECLLKRIIECSTTKGSTILDPFMGSGTTGKVAYEMGRKFIGIEKELKYYDIAVKRINSVK